jgi:hypothetical protein
MAAMGPARPQPYHWICIAVDLITWNSPEKLIIGRNQTAYSGTLSMCILYFRDQLSITRKVTCHITLDRAAVGGKPWLNPEEILELMTVGNLPAEL